MTSADVILSVSVDLNDQEPGFEYIRWEYDQIARYVCEAVTTLGTIAKDLFTVQCVVPVDTSHTWTKSCPRCSVINRVLGESDADGNIIRYLTNPLDIEANQWPGPVYRCPVTADNYTPSGYTVNANQPDEFRILPPPPAGVTMWVVVECFSAHTCGEDVPDELVPAVRQWCLYRALAVDAENNPAIIGLSQQHYKVFTDLYGGIAAERARRIQTQTRDVQNTTTQ